MGRFSVNVELANDEDLLRAKRGEIAQEDIRRIIISGTVDTGATRLVIPETVARQLGVELDSTVKVKYADGRTAQRSMVSHVHLSFGNRSSVFNAIVEPERTTALIGAIVLEDLDLIVDCTNQTLLPRDPHQIISEVE